MENAEWRAARADYEAGMKRKAICEKYGCTYTALNSKIDREGWGKTREKVARRAQEKKERKISDTIAKTEADSATIAADIKVTLLRKLKRIADGLPDDATEEKTNRNGKTTTKRLRDLTAAYKDLTGDQTAEQGPNDLLQSLLDLERGRA
jgi:hypothetical protein